MSTIPLHANRPGVATHVPREVRTTVVAVALGTNLLTVLYASLLVTVTLAGVAGARAKVAATAQPQPDDSEAPCGCHPDFHELGCHQPPPQPDR